MIVSDRDIKVKNDLGFNIINIGQKNKDINKDLKPILNKLLKIDPNLETLNKYLKNQKKNTYINYSNTLPNFKINTSKAKTKITNINPNTTNNEKNKNNVDDGAMNLLPLNSHNNIGIRFYLFDKTQQEE